MDQKIVKRVQALSTEKRKELAKLLEQKRAQSSVQVSNRYDVVIIGGGLAGGTLARQLAKADATINMLIVEKQQFPVPEVAHKVGESSIELGSYYLRDVVGAAEHLETYQLPKAGLRYFFPTDDNRDIAKRVELGCTKVLPTPSHQIDRGRFENMLHAENIKAGVDCWDNCSVKQIEFGHTDHQIPGHQIPDHQITVMRAGKKERVAARWVVDASGRASILKRQLGLQKEADHDASAIWFRIDDEINAADWSTDDAWQARVPRQARRLSTTHLMGRGYWVWLIPLPSGATSVGIVADNTLHPHAQMNKFERALAWLARYEPQCAQAIQARQDKLQDFRALRHYAHDCQRVFSPQRWCLTGEAGVFVDPFYSPGTDFISINNTFITALILKDRQGHSITQDVEFYNRIYLDTFHSFLRTFAGQYPLMGNAQVMTAKVVWDFSIYWGVNALIFFHNKTQDLLFWQEMRDVLARFDNLNLCMQQFFRDWDVLCAQHQWSPKFVNYMDIQFIHELHIGLEDGLDEDTLKAKVHENVNLLEAIANEMFQQASTSVTPLGELRSPVEKYQADEPASDQRVQATVNSTAVKSNDNHNGNSMSNHEAAPSSYTTQTPIKTDSPSGLSQYDIKKELGKIWLDVQMPRRAYDTAVIA